MQIKILRKGWKRNSSSSEIMSGVGCEKAKS